MTFTGERPRRRAIPRLARAAAGLIIAAVLLTITDAVINAASCAAESASASPSESQPALAPAPGAADAAADAGAPVFPVSPPASDAGPQSTAAPSTTDAAAIDEAPAPPARDAALDAAVQQAVDVAAERGERSAVAVYDRQTATLYAAGDYLDTYSSASIVKIAIAGQLLASGAIAEFEESAWDMIVRSDDNAANELYEIAGGDDVMVAFASRYGLQDYFGPPLYYGWWGTTRITAAGVALLYDAVANDPAVGPWLMSAMGAAECTAADGYSQCFGVAAAASDWRIKQGWSVGDPGDPGGKVHSTGFVNDDRYAVVMLTAGSPSIFGRYGNETATLMAQALMPLGSIA